VLWNPAKTVLDGPCGSSTSDEAGFKMRLGRACDRRPIFPLERLDSNRDYSEVGRVLLEFVNNQLLILEKEV
jgi:hypothetical protein